MLTRFIKTATIIAIALLLWQAPVNARDNAPDPMLFPDGSVGSAPAECGLGDLCASLKLPNGDVISVYNGGATNCKPYEIDVVRTHGDTVLFQSKRYSDDSGTDFLGSGNASCRNFKNTFLTFDSGQARLGLFLSHDGSLLGDWSGGKSGKNGLVVPLPSPSASP